MNRARDAWDIPVGKVAWGMHLLPEPKERVRELREHEETALNQAIRDDYLPALGFFIVSGCRLKEVVALKWKDIDWGARTISIMGKGDKPDVIPLTSELRSILWPLSGHHPEHVFTYVAQRSRTIQKTHRMIEKGKRYPITYEGLKTTWRRQGAPAVDDFRLHDTRHTAATRLLREGGNLKLVQRLLRHEDIATTAKYAHAQDEDLRAAMEAVSKSRANPRDDADDAENMKGKQRLK
jgi:integrase